MSVITASRLGNNPARYSSTFAFKIPGILFLSYRLLSESLTNRIAGFQRVNLEPRNILRDLTKLLGPPDQRRESAKVHRNHLANAEKPDRHCRFSRTHRVVIANWQKSEIRSVQFADQFHVAKNRRVPRVINRRAPGKGDDVTTGFPAVHDLVAILNPAGMDRIHHGDFDLTHSLSAALVHSIRIRNTFRFP